MKYTLDYFLSLSPSMQGNLWPLCANCNHIAQEHDEAGCGYHGKGQCKECGSWINNAKCRCDDYYGPQNVEELLKYLNSLPLIGGTDNDKRRESQ